MIRLAYPEERTVDEDTLIDWANDVLADTGDPPCDSVHEAIFVLEDGGYITVSTK